MSPQSVMASALFGRRDEVVVLEHQVERVLGGTGRTLLVSGEAGIGKSRLIRELERQFAQSTTAVVPVLRGQCYETDQTLPYAPLLDLLRSMLARQTPAEIAATLGGEATEIGALLPELATLLHIEPAQVTFGEQQERQRHFQALLRIFARIAGQSPLLIVIEDLHWSDDSSLEFIMYLARRITNLPILLALSYRSDEVQPALRHALASLDRERLAEEIPLARLTTSQVDAMLRSIFGQPQAIQADFLQAIHGLTDGNPFFIEEVLRALIAAGDIYQTGGRWDRKELAQLHVPRSIQDAVERRTERLGSPALEVLRLAAVAGRVFDFAALEALTSYSESSLLEIMRELIDAQLVVEESADRFAFRHALTRQTVYAQLLSRERRALHQKIGETLERLHAFSLETQAGDLAYHFSAAEDWRRTLNYAVVAGERAMTLYAPRAAVEQFNRAVDAANRLGQTPSTDLLRSRAQARTILGEFELADQDRQTVLDMARASRDSHAEWRALLELGELWGGHDYLQSGRYLDQALELARRLDDPRLIADSLTQVAGWMINREQPAEAESLLEDALRIFTDLDDRHGIARTVDLLGTAADIGGDMVRMHQRYQRAGDLFRSLDDRPGLSSALATDSIRCGAVGLLETVVTLPDGFDDALADADAALALARSIDWKAGDAYASLVSGSCLAFVGRYAEAIDRAMLGVRLSTEIEHREWMTASHYILGSIYLDLLAYDLARPHLEEAATLGREGGSLHFLHVTAGALAELEIATGARERAASMLAPFAADLPMSTVAQRRIWLARVRLMLAEGDATGALVALDQLFQTAPNMSGRADIPWLAWLEGNALLALREHDRAEAALQAARDGAATRGMQGLLWRIHATLASVHQALGRARQREEALANARASIEQIAASLPDDELRSAFVMRTGEIVPSAAKSAPALLTPRERDVVMLLAQGYSNREIADRLFVGERTVETHVGNVLAKLEFRSRAQIAAWVVEQGLASPADLTP